MDTFPVYVDTHTQDDKQIEKEIIEKLQKSDGMMLINELIDQVSHNPGYDRYTITQVVWYLINRGIIVLNSNRTLTLNR